MSAYALTLLDDADAATARATLGAQAALGYTPVNKAGDTGIGALTLTAALTATGVSVVEGSHSVVVDVDGTTGSKSLLAFGGTLPLVLGNGFGVTTQPV